ncbi:MAG: hypothetical protein GX681_03195 [Clostridiaceae bacterium]|nr:hypothetical protein [Clostridiaceae bacterium]
MLPGSDDFRAGSVKSYYDAARYCIEELEANSFEAYVVGGTVRDILSGRKVSDLDIATSARPDQVHKVFSGCRVVDTGIKHGTVTLILPADDAGKLHLEITTYRLESAYSDARHPDQVEFTDSIEEDLARRDLTINAMAWHPQRGLLDPYGGKNDLEAGVLRAVGLPEERFREDALRILRTLRLAAEMGFLIEKHTEDALIAARERLALVAAERLYVEWARLITAAEAGQIINKYWQVITIFLPEFSAFSDSVSREKYLPRLKLLPARFADRMAYLAALVSRGISTNLISPALSLCQSLKCPKKLAQEIVCLSEGAVTAFPPDKLSVDRVRQQLAASGRSFDDLLLLKSLLGQAQEDIEELRKIDQELSLANLHGLQSLDISGEDLVKLGFRGKAVGSALNKLYEAVLCDGLANHKDSLLARARTYPK